MLFDTVLAFDHVQAPHPAHRQRAHHGGRGPAGALPVRVRQDRVPRARARARAVAAERRAERRRPPCVGVNLTREDFEAVVGTREGAHRRRRHLPGRAVAALRGRRSAPIRSPSTARCARQSVALHVLHPHGRRAAIVGSSPEMLVRSKAGTSRRTRSPARGRAGATRRGGSRLGEELKRNEKERAEHVMLVDLGRNDLGRVCDVRHACACRSS